MKKQIIFLLLSLLPVKDIVAQNVNIPDANFKAALLANSEINLNADTEIQVSEAEAFNGTMDVNFQSISDMTGIEAFINLNILFCKSNNLTTLDISNNKALISLNCGYNDIETLVLGDKTNLQYLLFYYNEISELDVSAYPTIETFSANNNPLESIDLSSNSNLKRVEMSNCNLSFIDLRNGNNSAINDFKASGNPSLGCINVDDVPYATANWTDIDPGIIFSMDCSASYDVKFSVSDGTNPVEGAMIKFNQTYYSSDAAGEVLVEGISSGSYNYSVIAEGYASIMNSITVTNNVIESIVLSSGTSDIIYIPDYFLRSALLQDIAVNTNGDTEIQVSEGEDYNGEMDVYGLDITDMTGIEAFPNITALNCGKNDLTILDVSNNNLLTSLYCTFNSTIETLILGEQPYLEELSCSWNQISNLDVSGLTSLETLICGSNLFTELDLSDNPNLVSFDCKEGLLTLLDVRNGNNTAITTFEVTDNESLTCISVDDVGYAEENWTVVDTGVVFASNCFGSSDASLSSIQIDGADVEGFSSGIFDYEYELAEGTSSIPNVTATANDPSATIIITQAGSSNGTATIDVSAEDGSNETYTVTFSTALALGENRISGIRIYPNPVNDYLNINCKHIPDELIIYTLGGTIVERLKPGSKKLNTSHLQSGIYFIRIIEKNTSVYLKFIKG